MNAARVATAYRLAIRLYPKDFRDEFGDDLQLLLADQLADEGTARVVARTAVDLALSLPSRHLETHMRTNRSTSSSSIIPVLFGAIALSAVVVGVVVGHPAVLAACVAVALGSGALALVAAHRSRPLSSPRPASSKWWMVLTAGVTMLAALVVITNLTGELPDGGWLLAMVTGLTSLLLIGAGLVLGLVQLLGRRTESASSAL